VPQRSLACRVKREVPDGGCAGLAYGRQRRGLPSAQRPGHRALRPGWPVSRQASGAARVKASGPDAASIRGCTARTIPVPARSRPGASPAVTWLAVAPLPHAARSPGGCWRRAQRVQAPSPQPSAYADGWGCANICGRQPLAWASIAGPGRSRQMTESTDIAMAGCRRSVATVTDGPDRWIDRRTSD
jgi:hypothetical protein